VGVDYYLWALQISGAGTLLSGVNLVTTVLKVRAPGMNYLRMPIFCWTTLASNLLIVAAFPILTATLAMLLLDRYLGFHFFTNDAGGNPMMFMNLIWAWGHPEVYILVLPAFGIFSEVFATFSAKPLFGYRSMVAATMAICILSFMVWLHHFFTMGAGANVNAIFGIATMIIAVPTGVKIYNWLFTMYSGRVVFEPPMLWALGFVVTFVIGGMTGVLLAVPPADFVLHNSLFLVAHFHNVIIGGVVFGLFAGYEYWFPKAFGFRLHKGLGVAAFWFWIVGFFVAFMPLYALGLMGMTRRMQHYDVPEWQPWLQVAAAGAALIAIGVALQVIQLVWSIRHRATLRDTTGDPWNGRTLEWMTPSPPPMFNYAVMPDIGGVEAYWMRKQSAIERQALLPEPEYHDIHMPRNSSAWLHLRLLLGDDGLRADLAHLVAGRAGVRGRLGRVRRRRLARRARGGDPGGDRRGRRPRQSRRPRSGAADAEAGHVSALAEGYPGRGGRRRPRPAAHRGALSTGRPSASSSPTGSGSS
jgi:cytochrome o ubiquinol oxidase subunit 1